MKICLSETATLFHGDCRETLRAMPANSIDSVVTDPPYELNFMGRGWDRTGIANDPELWRSVYRVLKPGSQLAAFSASRTYHRMTCAIEDAGFEIRDSLMWIYGSGFPKSHNLEGKFEGWGTALKPAFEPIVLARKQLSEKTVSSNVLRWGTGAINIDGCRVAGIEDTSRPQGKDIRGGNWSGDGGRSDLTTGGGTGRWPANVVHDGSDEVVGMFPVTSSGRAAAGGHKRKATMHDTEAGWGMRHDSEAGQLYADSGSAARFFYSAKASKADRNGSKHPTVKPISLMQWLARLITPPGGIVLDPFAGSGTTGVAAALEGFRAILCEQEAEYVADIHRRYDVEQKVLF